MVKLTYLETKNTPIPLAVVLISSTVLVGVQTSNLSPPIIESDFAAFYSLKLEWWVRQGEF